ncbi:site-specific integrase [Thalassobaculum salexigens]|uniref:site-specific integrase n=1 Tax=Thalassobaculum salexigens TaxID=455360 RepID=UPI0006859B53|nr:site-specific integrase [Thalassobaculum salexigens]
MPTIRKRNRRWQAQVRVANKAPITKTFDRYQDAVAWAAETEKNVRRSLANDTGIRVAQTTLGDLIDRYQREITPAKRSSEVEALRLGKMRRDAISGLVLSKLSPSVVSDYRDRRMAEVSVDTVRRDLGTLQHVWDVAHRSWGLVGLDNPFRLVRRPSPAPGRARRLSVEEQARLEAACAKCRNEFVPLVVRFALETAMRQGEILALQKRDIDMGRRLALVRYSKNGRSRLVPLSETARSAARDATSRSGEERVFPLTAMSVKLAWRRALKRAGLEDLHFHDLRHEAISRSVAVTGRRDCGGREIIADRDPSLRNPAR